MKVRFEKWQGLGNDFIILEEEIASRDLALKLCNRNFGIGADGLFSPKESKKADIGWNFFNSDGSPAQMCGNGIRCFAKYVQKKGYITKNIITIETLKGIITCEHLKSGLVKVDMGYPILEPEKIPIRVENNLDFEVEGFSASALSMGNPHCVIFAPKDGEKLALEFGKSIENSPLFPEKTNVEFVNAITRNKIKMNVWERGCGITLACGTGACASVVVGVLNNLLDNDVEVFLRGGILKINYVKGESVFMTGDAKKVFEGEISI